MGPLIIASSLQSVGGREAWAGGPIKQRSPADGRWAEKEIHQIEKMRHCESLIVEGEPVPVKLERIFAKIGHAAHVCSGHNSDHAVVGLLMPPSALTMCMRYTAKP
jgi:hypothetical protein